MANPIAPKPTSIIAQLVGSGTAATAFTRVDVAGPNAEIVPLPLTR